MENQLMKIDGTNHRSTKRNSRGAKAMAVVTGGMLAVIAAVRVTTAQEASTMPTTQPDAMTSATTQPMVSADSATIQPLVAVDSATTQPTIVADVATTQPTAMPEAFATPTINDASSAVTMPASRTRIINVQYSPSDAAAATTAPSNTTDQPATNSSGLVSNGVDHEGRVTIAMNKSAVISTRFPYKRISVGQPEIADVNPIGAGSLLVTGKKAGTTQIILWDDQEHSQVIDVDIIFDLRALQDQLKTMFPDSAIEVKSLNGAIALRGRVPNAQTAEQVVAVATPFSQKILNFMEVGGGQQVQLQVRIAEVSRTASSELGVNLGYTDGVGFGGSNIGGVNPFGVGGGALVGNSLTEGSPSSGATTLFGSLKAGGTVVDVFVDALRQNNLLRILAEPNLIAISGQAASFLAGGEYPIPVPQGSSGGVTTTIEYRDYGVRLNFVPLVLGDGRIRLKVSPEVSELDYAHSVNLNGYTVPGLTTRKVETCVELTEGQTFAIAGLLNNMQTSQKSVTPLLGDLPVLGALFRSVRYERQETELVVLVTPRIVSGMNPDQVPSVPGEHWHDPSDAELFLNRDIGGDVSAATQPSSGSKRPAPRYHGHYGYQPEAASTTQTASAE
ncbi:MAG: pilus assembly protein N-terminal domain-containing protein [Phycisphaerae bacterium]|nr:pilus assembly protein N-terminal domain-containing protein [Phycisphaerae bacterium]